MAIDKVTYAAAKKYTDNSVAGGGAIKGKNCVVDSIIDITGGHRVTFKWTLDDGSVQTGYMDVMDGVDGADGADGRGITSTSIDTNNHLIITYNDGATQDAGEIKVDGQTPQRNVLPTASASENGNIYQYIGADTTDLTNGFFYQCKPDGAGGYEWVEKPVQRGGGGGPIDQNLDPTSHNAVENMAIAVPIQALQGSMADVKLDITQLQASDLSLRTAIHDLDLIVASKVDKEAGKGLSSNDYTDAEKEKLGKLQPIYLIGSGLNLDGSTLKATGIDIPIDTALDPTSANPVQNKAIAVPVQALQGSMSNVKLDVAQLQASMANKADKSDVTNIQLDITALQGSVASVKSDIGNIELDITALQGSLANKADKVSGATANNFAGLDANGNLKDSGKSALDFLYGSIIPAPAPTITDAALKQAINGAGSNDDKVPTGYAMRKWSNSVTKRYIVAGATHIGTTGIGTWYDGDPEDLDPSTDETDWLEIADLIGIESADDIDIDIKYDPSSNEPIVKGGYEIDTTTGKMCIKFANEIATPANAKVAIDITFLRNEYSTIS